MYEGKIYNTITELADALNVSVGELFYCVDNAKVLTYKKTEPKKDGSLRRLTAPRVRLKSIQRRIKSRLLAKYSFPDYIFGVGGDTLKDHAAVHAGQSSLVQVDLRDFFPSITHDMVYRVWAEAFRMPQPVARILTKLTTCDGSLQQGFPTSSHLAAIVAKPMAEKIEEYGLSHELKFSQYVDDINLSGRSVDYKGLFMTLVVGARAAGFSLKPRKTKVTNALNGKVITGASVFGARVRTPRPIRKRAIAALKALSTAPTDKIAKKRALGYARHMTGLSRSEGRAYLQKIKAIAP